MNDQLRRAQVRVERARAALAEIHRIRKEFSGHFVDPRNQAEHAQQEQSAEAILSRALKDLADAERDAVADQLRGAHRG